MSLPAINDTNATGIIILAAGESMRIGSPKQLLKYHGVTLLQRAIDTAQASRAGSVTVVLGAHYAIIEKEIKSAIVRLVINPAWEEGMASSIAYGINTVTKSQPVTEAVILMVADQPFVTTELLNQLMKEHLENGAGIVASQYSETFGIPVLFDKRFFPELSKLKGDTGAKSIIRAGMKEAAFVSFPKGHIDIDTMDDFEDLSQRQL